MAMTILIVGVSNDKLHFLAEEVYGMNVEKIHFSEYQEINNPD
jgi:hypothetical protein